MRGTNRSSKLGLAQHSCGISTALLHICLCLAMYIFRQGSQWTAGSRHILVQPHAHAGGMLLAGLMGKLQACVCIRNKTA